MANMMLRRVKSCVGYVANRLRGAWWMVDGAWRSSSQVLNFAMRLNDVVSNRLSC